MPSEKDDPMYLSGGAPIKRRKLTPTQIGNLRRAEEHSAAGLPPPVGDPEPIRIGSGAALMPFVVIFAALAAVAAAIGLHHH